MQYSLWQLALLLAAAALAAPLGKQLKVGSVPGYLAAGIVIGPHVLGIFNEPENILHIAEIGVVMLLFLIGLELRPQRLWSMRMAVFGLGGAQVAATAIVLGSILAMITDLRTALFCGLALSLSSTAFVLQMLKERGELDTRHGRLAFAVLLFQDIAAIPMIALVGLLSPRGAATMTPWTAIGGLLSIAAIILAGRFLLTRLYRFVAATGLQEAMTASALLTVIVIVILMNAAGLSAALGAFIAGLVLADSEYRHEIEANISPFEGLLLGLFFVAVGMSLDLTLLARHPLAIALAVIALVAIKIVVLWPLGRTQRLSFGGSRRLALALSQGGEFAFVLTAAATAERAISLATADLINVVVTLSMLTTPFLLMLDDRLRARRPPAVPLYDKAMPQGDGHVVIAGLGRFGQIVARILRARRIPFTALDKSAEQVDFVRRFGSEIYYGDASRLEILEAAQTGRARAFVLAIDDVEVLAADCRAGAPSLPRAAHFCPRSQPHPCAQAHGSRRHRHRARDLSCRPRDRPPDVARHGVERGRDTPDHYRLCRDGHPSPRRGLPDRVRPREDAGQCHAPGRGARAAVRSGRGCPRDQGGSRVAPDVGWHRFIPQKLDRGIKAHRLLLRRAEPAHVHRALLDLALAGNQDHRHLGKRVLAHLVGDLLVAQVALDPKSRIGEPLDDLPGIVVGLRHDRRDDDLHRRDPERQRTGVMLEQDADETFHRAADRPVDHRRRLLLSVMVDIERTEALRQVEIDLGGAALPVAPDRIAQHILEFGTVEGALPRIDASLDAAVRLPRDLLEHAHQHLLGVVPHLVGADPLVRPGRQLHHHVVEAEIRIGRQDQIVDGEALGPHLVLGAEDMRIILGERPDPHQPVQRP